MEHDGGMDTCSWCGAPVQWVRPFTTWKKCDPHIGEYTPQGHLRYIHICRVSAYRDRMEEIGTHPAVVKDWVDALIARANREHASRRREETGVVAGVA